MEHFVEYKVITLISENWPVRAGFEILSRVKAHKRISPRVPTATG
jgi:hypothetical protein